jgi:hypothetical protein
MNAAQRVERDNSPRLPEEIDEPRFEASLEQRVSAFRELSDRITSCSAYIVIAVLAQRER